MMKPLRQIILAAGGLSCLVFTAKVIIGFHIEPYTANILTAAADLGVAVLMLDKQPNYVR